MMPLQGQRACAAVPTGELERELLGAKPPWEGKLNAEAHSNCVRFAILISRKSLPLTCKLAKTLADRRADARFVPDRTAIGVHL